MLIRRKDDHAVTAMDVHDCNESGYEAYLGVYVLVLDESHMTILYSRDYWEPVPAVAPVETWEDVTAECEISPNGKAVLHQLFFAPWNSDSLRFVLVNGLRECGGFPFLKVERRKV